MNMLTRFFFMKLLLIRELSMQKESQKQLLSQTIKQSYRILPHDMGWRLHLPNYRYLSFIELNISKFLLKVSKTFGCKIHSLVAMQEIVYLKEVKFLDQLSVETKIEGWDNKYIYFQHTFKVKQQVVSIGLTKVLLVANKQKCLPADIGLDDTHITQVVETWQNNQTAIKNQPSSS
ncbi:acyl-CoA thioesterase [Psychrobacter sp. HD31]|uniref:thioesterase family protein n=1 Tax=Psychrobacter sp. HD31 TaxID=3112003 RepID=UPI003DA5712C